MVLLLEAALRIGTVPTFRQRLGLYLATSGCILAGGWRENTKKHVSLTSDCRSLELLVRGLRSGRWELVAIKQLAQHV